MIFKTLKIQGFKSFNLAQSISFKDNISGLYLIAGDNQVNPALKGNGAGKSSIIEAIVFCLFGHTSLKLKGEKVKNWGGDQQCNVILIFEINNITYTLERTWDPITILLNNRTVGQDEINNLIRFDFNTFMYGIIVPTFNTSFFELTSENRLKIFENLFELDYWVELSYVAKNDSEDVCKKISNRELEISKLDYILSNSKVKEYTNQFKKWKHTRDKLFDTLDQEIKKYTEEIDVINRSKHSIKNDLDAKIDENKNKIIGIQTELDKLNSKLNELILDKQKYQDMIVEFTTHRQIIDKAIDRMKNSASICNECSQPISDAYKKKYILSNNERLEKINSRISTININIADIQSNETKLKDKIFNIERKKTKFNKQISEYMFEMRGELEKCESKIALLRQKRAYIDEQKQINDNSCNPFEALLEDEKLNNSKSRHKRIEVKSEINDLESDKLLISYWINGFKEIRLMIINQLLRTLEVYANSYLVRLGLDGWKIMYATEVETKKGTIKKGFQISVLSNHSDNTIRPLECWSGGERQRLILASTLALMDLLYNKSGSVTNIEFFDEPTQHLSDSGITALLEILQERSERENKQIYIIDHRDFNILSIFRKTLTVIKSSEGSIISA